VELEKSAAIMELYDAEFALASIVGHVKQNFIVI